MQNHEFITHWRWCNLCKNRNPSKELAPLEDCCGQHHNSIVWLCQVVVVQWKNLQPHHKPNCWASTVFLNLEMRDWCSTLQITLIYLHILTLNFHSFQTPKTFSSTADLDTICLPHNCVCLNRIIRQTNNYTFAKTSCTWIWLNCTLQHHNCCWQQDFPVFLPTLIQMLGDRQRNKKKLKSEKERKKI